MRESVCRYRDEATQLTGHLVDGTPPSATARAGILLVHGGAGLDDHARDRARRIAALGYVVLACDMYGDTVRDDPARIRPLIAELMDDRDRLCGRAVAALEELTAYPGVRSRPAAVGYCFGGTVALTLARAGIDLAGAAAVHGGLTTTRPAAPGTVVARVLVSHGGADPFVPPEHVLAFTSEMLAAGADWELHVHPGAQHGFTHRHLADGTPPTPGVAYDAAADERSSAVLSAFLSDLFGTGPRPRRHERPGQSK